MGSLVNYTAHNLHVSPSGQVQGEVIVTPVRFENRFRAGDDRYNDRFVIPIDIKPPSRVHFTSPPERPYRSYTAVEVPGFYPPTVPMYPTANQFVDKICAPTDPPHTNRKVDGPPPPRVKDLFDAYFLLRTCRMVSTDLQAALEDRAQARGWAGAFEVPYRLYGQRPLPPGQMGVDWVRAYAESQRRDPVLKNYPPFAQVYHLLNQCVTGLAEGRGQEWVPGRGWVHLVPARIRNLMGAMPPTTIQPLGARPKGQQPPGHPRLS